MADIQIPQRNPQYVAPVAPSTDLINALYNRPKPGEIAASQLGEGVEGLLNQYYKQKQLQVGAFEAGGPYLMNLLSGRGQQPQPGQQSSLQPSTTPQNATPQANAGGGVSSPSVSTANIGQDTTPQPLMHPTSGLPQTIHDHMANGGPDFLGVNQQAGNPNMGAHASKIQNIQNQMVTNSQMGKYGETLNRALQDQLGAEKSLMEGEQFNVGQQRQSDQFNQSQNAEESRFQRNQNQKVNESIATKGSEQKASQTQVDLLNQTFSNLDNNLHEYYKSGAGFGSANVNQATLGRGGSKVGGAVLEDSNAMLTMLNKTLTARFGQVGQDLLGKSFKVNPNEPPDVTARKMRNIHGIIKTLDTANKQQMRSYISTITGQVNGQ